MTTLTICETEEHESIVRIDKPLKDDQEYFDFINQKEAEDLETNKTNLFNTLIKAEIAKVELTFDGYGDSGQVDGIEARNSHNEPVELTSHTTTQQNSYLNALENTNGSANTEKYTECEIRTVTKTTTIEIAVEDMFWDAINKHEEGWDLDAGGYGTFTIDCTEKTITLDLHERSIITKTHDI